MFFSGVIAVIFGIMWVVNADMVSSGFTSYQGSANTGKKGLKTTLTIFCLIGFISIFIPNEKQLKWLVGAYIADQALTNDEIKDQLKQLPVKSLDVVNSGLEGLAGFAKDLTTVLDKE
jgi:hypothetical protein